MRKLIFLMGLPASGKTYWANKQSSCSVLHLDELDEAFLSDKTNPLSSWWDKRDIIFDGLFLSTESLVGFIKSFYTPKCNTSKFEIHFWKEDREQCLRNDSLRQKERSEKSSITIKNAILEYPDINRIKKEFPEISVSVEEHEVYIATASEVFAYENDIELDSDGCFRSPSWSLGGTWNDCWGYTGRISPELQPNFDEFDKLLRILCPDVSFLDYKNIYNETVRLETYSESDYYGGSEDKAYYICNFKKLYEILRDKEYLE